MHIFVNPDYSSFEMLYNEIECVNRGSCSYIRFLTIWMHCNDVMIHIWVIGSQVENKMNTDS